MSLKDRLKNDMKDAMRNKEIQKRDTIRFLNSSIKQIEVDERKDVTDADIIKLIQKFIKQREEVAIQYREANREDLVEIELSQANILKEYLPKQLNDDELKAKIEEICKSVGAESMKDMGKVMGVATKELAGIADGKRINSCVKEVLS